MAAVSVSLYNFSKKKNSTKRPTSTGSSYSCLLKEGTDKWSPTFILSGDPSACNYCSAWGLYYYIDRMEYQPPHWHLTCTLDPMASWKTDIGAASLYVTRADSSTQRDDRLVDQLPSRVGPAGEIAVTSSEPFAADTPSYVISIAGSTTQTGHVQWVCSETEYLDFIKAFTKLDSWTFPSAWQDAEKSRINPIDYIKDVRWYPFTPTCLTINDVYINGWKTGAQAHPMVEGTIKTVNNTISIPRHPDAASYGFFLNGSQYSHHTYVDPWFGVIDIDGNSSAIADTLHYRMDIDPSCAYAHMRIWTTSSAQAYFMADRDCEFGVPVMFSQQNHGVQTIVSDLAGAVANAATLNIGGMVSNLASAVGSFLHPKLQTTGSVGSRMLYSFAQALYSEFVRVVPLDHVTQGWPVCKTLTISSLSGFVQVAKGDVAIAGPSWAADQIRSYLEGGFYYE